MSCSVTDVIDTTSDFIVDQVVRFPYGPCAEQNKAQLRKTERRSPEGKEGQILARGALSRSVSSVSMIHCI